MTRATLALVVALGLAASSTAAPKPRPTIAGTTLGDTVWVRGSWKSLDARGNPVAQYTYRYLRNGLEAASGTTPDTAVVRAFLRPLAGDTAEYVIEVVAVDVRGIASQPGRSPVLRIITPWTPPGTPDVVADTLTAEGSDSISTMFLMLDGTVAYDSAEASSFGDFARLCMLGWTGGRPYVLGGQDARCGGRP